MRLLNVRSFEFQEFLGEDIPRYAIASHRWCPDEPTFQNFRTRHDAHEESEGLRKVHGFCDFTKAWYPELQWLWIDTCCVDKTSSAELTEVINSMFRYYSQAEICIAYLFDVRPICDGWPLVLDDFEHSVWHKRGWTLQELLAPQIVVFLTQAWEPIGHKGSLQSWPTERNLNKSISAATKIPESVLANYSLSKNMTVEARLAWVSERDTTRVEDITYCLLGIFDVFMPLIYGEGRKARDRLLLKLGEYQNERAQIIKWFSNCHPGDHHEDIRCRQPLTSQTTEWLFNSEEAGSYTFQQWRNSSSEAPDHQLLWAHGHPGVGKTTIASQVIEYLFSSDAAGSEERVGVGWAYVGMIVGEQLPATERLGLPTVLLCSVIQSLLQQMPEIPHFVKSFYQEHTSRARHTLPSVSQVLQCLHNICSRAYDKVYIIVDGLDEMDDQDQRNAISLLKQLPPRAKLMVFSRYMESIRNIVGSLLQIQISVHRRDAQLFFEQKCQNNAAFSSLVEALEESEPGAKAILEDAIAQRADFSFLAAKLCMNILMDKHTPYELRQAAHDLPTPKTVYQTLIKRLVKNWDLPDQVSWSKRILTWICFGNTTLSPRELLYVIGLDIDRPKLDHNNLLTPPTLITSLCDGLVSIHAVTQRVSLVHMDAHQHFQQHEESYFPEARIDLAEMCIAHIRAASELGHRIIDHELFSLTEQTVKNLSCHVRLHMTRTRSDQEILVRGTRTNELDKCNTKWSQVNGRGRGPVPESMSVRLLERLVGLLEDERCLNFLCFMLTKNIGYPDTELSEWTGATKLHVAAAMGFVDVVGLFAANKQLLDAKDDNGKTALSVALEKNHTDVAEVLVQSGALVDLHHHAAQMVFVAAVEKGEIGFSRKLLESQEVDQRQGLFCVQSKPKQSRTVRLLLAALNNDAETVAALVASTEMMKTHAVSTALLVAADCGHLGIVQKLLDSGVSVESKDTGDRTALHKAVQRNNAAMVRTLLHYQANVNAMDKNGNTPWTETLRLQDHEEISQIMLKYNGNIDATDGHGVSALHMACAAGHIDIMKRLLGAGADPSIRTPFLWTPMHWSAFNGQFDVTSILIEYGADINALTDMAETPLQLALRSSAHHKYMCASIFQNTPVSSTPAFVQGALTPCHAPWTCRACGMDIEADDMAFSCHHCDAGGYSLCCSCFLHEAWCLDREHALASNWALHEGGAVAENKLTSIDERDMLRQGSIAGMLRRQGAMTRDEVRRHYERSWGVSIAMPLFRELAFSHKIRTVGEEMDGIELQGPQLTEDEEDDDISDTVKQRSWAGTLARVFTAKTRKLRALRSGR